VILTKDVFGALKVSAVSSGFCIGSCNWIISSFKERIVYMSGSSTLTTHPMSCDQSGLKNADVLLLTGLSQTPSVNPDAMLGEFCQSVASTLKVWVETVFPWFTFCFRSSFRAIVR
jgi:integrator complex subunit 9